MKHLTYSGSFFIVMLFLSILIVGLMTASQALAVGGGDSGFGGEGNGDNGTGGGGADNGPGESGTGDTTSNESTGTEESSDKGGLFGNGGFLGLGENSGILGDVLDGIAGFFGGIFSGKSNSNSDNVSNPPGEGSLNVVKVFDLSPTSTESIISANKVTFVGSIITTRKPTLGTVAGQIGKVLTLNNKINIDYSCDNSINSVKEFTEEYTVGMQTPIEISEKIIVDKLGTHCFTIIIDTNNQVNETNENNNVSDKQLFTVVSLTDIKLSDLTIPSGCKLYITPVCADGEKVYPGAKLVNGCLDSPYCATITTEDSDTKLGGACTDSVNCNETKLSTSLDNMIFEVKVFSESTDVNGGATVRVLKKDWSSDDIEVNPNDVLQFRWGASPYSKCLVDINPKTYIFDGSTTNPTGNTEESGIAISTRADTYSVSCRLDNIQETKNIKVTLSSS